jgi:hypothetical protein
MRFPSRGVTVDGQQVQVELFNQIAPNCLWMISPHAIASFEMHGTHQCGCRDVVAIVSRSSGPKKDRGIRRRVRGGYLLNRIKLMLAFRFPS